MVWGSFAESKVSDLCRVSSNTPWYMASWSGVLQQDNCPKPTSRLCRSTLKEKNKTVGFKSWNGQHSFQT